MYNTAPEYMRPCLDSVLQQSYRNLEIILVDDHSTDANTLKTLEEYATKEPQIKLVHHKENQGIASTRNTRADAATGEYKTSDLFTEQSSTNHIFTAMGSSLLNSLEKA